VLDEDTLPVIEAMGGGDDGCNFVGVPRHQIQRRRCSVGESHYAVPAGGPGSKRQIVCERAGLTTSLAKLRIASAAAG
jgi:hypothetical protein